MRYKNNLNYTFRNINVEWLCESCYFEAEQKENGIGRIYL